VFTWDNIYSAGAYSFFNKNHSELFPKYMRRILYEYTAREKKSISKRDGKIFIKDIYKAADIEKEIQKIINKSKKGITLLDYSNNLVQAINRMYEVIFIIYFQQGVYVNDFDKLKPDLSNASVLKEYVIETIKSNGGSLNGIPHNNTELFYNLYFSSSPMIDENEMNFNENGNDEQFNEINRFMYY
jgi:hypothetical protein